MTILPFSSSCGALSNRVETPIDETKEDHDLSQVLEEYKEMDAPCKLKA